MNIEFSLQLSSQRVWRLSLHGWSIQASDTWARITPLTSSSALLNPPSFQSCLSSSQDSTWQLSVQIWLCELLNFKHQNRKSPLTVWTFWITFASHCHWQCSVSQRKHCSFYSVLQHLNKMCANYSLLHFVSADIIHLTWALRLTGSICLHIPPHAGCQTLSSTRF